jgi:hypothetical protein
MGSTEDFSLHRRLFVTAVQVDFLVAELLIYILGQMYRDEPNLTWPCVPKPIFQPFIIISHNGIDECTTVRATFIIISRHYSKRKMHISSQ